MLDISLEGKLGRLRNALRHNVLPIAILAAAIGWLFVVRVVGPRGLAKWAPGAARSSRQRVDSTGDGLDLDTVKYQVARKKLLSSEPMAGYGA
jgi:hypothetical protein